MSRKASPKAAKRIQIRDRVKELRRVPASQLQPNPRNWRTHPQAQQDALRGILAEVGIAGAVLARETAEGGLMLIDGHLRTETMPDQEIPVLVLDVSEEEANLLLATFDPLGAMAEANASILDDLLRETNTGNEALMQMLEQLAESNGVFDVSESDPPELADGDREPFQQMTFTLHDSQAATIKAAIDAAKAAGPFDGSPNENSNGNALARIAEAYCGSR